MKKSFLLAGSLSLLGLVSTIAPASAEQINSVDGLMSEAQSDSMGQVTSVSQLSDVQPTDWAFQALQSLVERYGCIAGYPDGTFRGNRSATRYEMAAALNACLDNISDKFATKEDLEAVKALQEEFQAELATLRGRVDGLEARTDTLEAQQFSTTTKLQGEAVIAGQYGDFIDSDVDDLPNIALGDSRVSVLSRVRLNFNTSFNGSDLLQTQLEVGNNGQDFLSTAFGLDTGFDDLDRLPDDFVDLGVTDYSGIGNTVRLRRLAYSFKPFGEDLTLTAGSNLFPSDFVDFNSYANNSAQDFSSGFFINNPLIITNAVDAGGGAGGAFDWNPNGGPISVRGTYVAAEAGNPVDAIADDGRDSGLFGDPNQATVELEFADTFGSSDQNNAALRLQYTRANTFGLNQNVVGANAEATFGQFGIFGRFGYSIDPKVELGGGTGDTADLFAGGDADFNNNVISWMAGVGVKDLIVPGSLLAFAGGQPFLLTGAPDGSDYQAQTNLEGFYRVAINDNITLTPSVQVILNPGSFDVADTNTTIVQGLLRATFSF